MTYTKIQYVYTFVLIYIARHIHDNGYTPKLGRHSSVKMPAAAVPLLSHLPIGGRTLR